jgi:hypothetical protein
MKMLIRKSDRCLNVTVTDCNTTIELKLLTKDEAVALQQELLECVDYLKDRIIYWETWSLEGNNK